MAQEKDDLKTFQILMPFSLALIIGSLIFGAFNKVSFRNDEIFSYSSFTLPGNPFIRQMLVHRSMMAILAFACVAHSTS
jgi:hypothetical protein